MSKTAGGGERSEHSASQLKTESFQFAQKSALQISDMSGLSAILSMLNKLWLVDILTGGSPAVFEHAQKLSTRANRLAFSHQSLDWWKVSDISMEKIEKLKYMVLNHNTIT